MRDYTNAAHLGEAKEHTVLIQVRCDYLTLPLLVVVVGCLFVLLSIWETRRLRLPRLARQCHLDAHALA